MEQLVPLIFAVAGFVGFIALVTTLVDNDGIHCLMISVGGVGGSAFFL